MCEKTVNHAIELHNVLLISIWYRNIVTETGSSLPKFSSQVLTDAFWPWLAFKCILIPNVPSICCFHSWSEEESLHCLDSISKERRNLYHYLCCRPPLDFRSVLPFSIHSSFIFFKRNSEFYLFFYLEIVFASQSSKMLRKMTNNNYYFLHNLFWNRKSV